MHDTTVNRAGGWAWQGRRGRMCEAEASDTIIRQGFRAFQRSNLLIVAWVASPLQINSVF
jgi:hypothetical protein